MPQSLPERSACAKALRKLGAEQIENICVTSENADSKNNSIHSVTSKNSMKLENICAKFENLEDQDPYRNLGFIHNVENNVNPTISARNQSGKHSWHSHLSYDKISDSYKSHQSFESRFGSSISSRTRLELAKIDAETRRLEMAMANKKAEIEAANKQAEIELEKNSKCCMKVKS